MTADISDYRALYARHNELSRELEENSAAVTAVMQSKGTDGILRSHDELEALFAVRDRITDEIDGVEAEFQALQPYGVDFGYSHDNNTNNSTGAYEPITPDGSGRRWFSSLSEAVRRQRNDLRWRIPTFIISRPTPAPAIRLEE